MCRTCNNTSPSPTNIASIVICLTQYIWEYTDLVEPFSVDESWLDVTARMLLSDTKIIADNREACTARLGLTLSAGVSFNKIFAKMGSDYRNLTQLQLAPEVILKNWLWPMAVSEMFFVGRSTAIN